MERIERRWWFDDQYKLSLTLRCEETWYVLVHDFPNAGVRFPVPGKVQKICYAGYKILLPDEKTTLIANPDTMKIEDLAQESYDAAVARWRERMNEIERLKAQELAEKEAFRQFQRSCPHNHIKDVEYARVAGCDIDDQVCLRCQKILRRHYSTAYEKDPDDEISDWDWWVGYYEARYHSIPIKENFRIVENL